MKVLRHIPLLILFAFGNALAGVVFEIETKDHTSSESGLIQASVEGTNLKMVVVSADMSDKDEMIFRGDRREMVVVDHGDKSYMVIDEAMIQSIGKKLTGIDAQMQKMLADVPPEQRAMFEKMMQGRMPQQTQAPAKSIVEFRNTGERGTRNGYPCVKYEVSIGGRQSQEMWVTDWDNIEGGADAASAFESMATFFQDMRDAMPSFGRESDADDNPFQHMSELNGFPVVTYDYAPDGSLEGESALRSSKRRTLDPAEFEPPSGYKRRTMMPN